MKVPVVVHCPPAVLPSAQSVLASGQSVPFTTVPPCDPCDSAIPDRRPQVRSVPPLRSPLGAPATEFRRTPAAP